MKNAVRFATSVLDEIRRAAARAYPFEGCGALLGSPDGHVLEATALPNAEGERLASASPSRQPTTSP